MFLVSASLILYKQALKCIKGHLDPDTVIAGNVNTPLSYLERYSELKLDQKTYYLNYAVDKVVHRDTEHSMQWKGYVFFSAEHRSC